MHLSRGFSTYFGRCIKKAFWGIARIAWMVMHALWQYRPCEGRSKGEREIKEALFFCIGDAQVEFGCELADFVPGPRRNGIGLRIIDDDALFAVNHALAHVDFG